MYRDILVPKPIGEVYCHRHLRNGVYVEHHESLWRKDDGQTYSSCEKCGKRVLVSDLDVEEFNKPEVEIAF